MDETFQLSIETLEWAASNAGRSLSDFAHDLYAKNETAINITNGKLTIPQIKKFASSAKVPFGFLFLPSPPCKYQPNNDLIDFRTVNNKLPLSRDFIDIYKDIDHKQSWYRDYLIKNDASELPFVGKYQDKGYDFDNEIAHDIRKTISLSNVSKSLPSANEYYASIVRKCEDVGILVFKNSVVVNSTRRKLNSEEFRGFVISDNYAPVIFINGDDSQYANIFTLAHELAHLWLGESGISDADVNSNNKNEIRCNKIAAEVLVPKNDFIYQWDAENYDFKEKISTLNRLFKVSELVIARIALTNGRITKDNYWTIHFDAIKRWHDKKLKDKNIETRIPFKTTLAIKNSGRITKTVIELVKSNMMQPSEAAIILNINAATVAAL